MSCPLRRLAGFFQIAALAAASLILCAAVHAQVPTSGNVFFGYSYYNTDLSSIDRANTNGFEGSLEGRIFPFVGLVADFDGHYGSQNFPASICGLTCSPAEFNASVTEHNYLFGPRVSFSVKRFRPFAEALFGAAHVDVNNGVGSDTSFATASITRSSSQWRGGSKETTSRRGSLAGRRITSEYRLGLCCASRTWLIGVANARGAPQASGARTPSSGIAGNRCLNVASCRFILSRNSSRDCILSGAAH